MSRNKGWGECITCRAEDLQVWWKSVVHVHVDGPDCIMAINWLFDSLICDFMIPQHTDFLPMFVFCFYNFVKKALKQHIQDKDCVFFFHPSILHLTLIFIEKRTSPVWLVALSFYYNVHVV